MSVGYLRSLRSLYPRCSTPFLVRATHSAGGTLDISLRALRAQRSRCARSNRARTSCGFFSFYASRGVYCWWVLFFFFSCGALCPCPFCFCPPPERDAVNGTCPGPPPFYLGLALHTLAPLACVGARAPTPTTHVRVSDCTLCFFLCWRTVALRPHAALNGGAHSTRFMLLCVPCTPPFAALLARARRLCSPRGGGTLCSAVVGRFAPSRLTHWWGGAAAPPPLPPSPPLPAVGGRFAFCFPFGGASLYHLRSHSRHAERRHARSARVLCSIIQSYPQRAVARTGNRAYYL